MMMNLSGSVPSPGRVDLLPWAFTCGRTASTRLEPAVVHWFMARIRSWTLLVAWLVALGGAGVAQQSQPAPSATETTPIRIDAVVTDSQGRPILDLRPSDFE